MLGDSEQHGTAGDNHLFGGDSRDERHGDLPVAQAQRLEKGHDHFSKNRSEACFHFRGVAAGAEIQNEPHDNGRQKNRSARFGDEILDFFPDINGHSPSAGRFVFRKLNQKNVWIFPFIRQMKDRRNADGYERPMTYME